MEAVANIKNMNCDKPAMLSCIGSSSFCVTTQLPPQLLLSLGMEVPFLSLFKDKKGKGAGYPAKESHKLPQRICKFDVIIAFFTTIYAFLLLMKKKEKEKPKFHT